MTGKILIKCDLVVRTGLHIGGSSSFSAIGTLNQFALHGCSLRMPFCSTTTS